MALDDKKEASKDSAQPPSQKEGLNSAAAALELLRSLAVADSSPENLERAFLDWARLSADALSNPEFEHILSTFVSASADNEREADPTSHVQPSSTQRFDLSDVFFVDVSGIVTDISSELSDLLQVKVGDALEPGLFLELFEKSQSSDNPPFVPITIELKDKFQLKRRVVIHEIEQNRAGAAYAAVFIRIKLSENANNVLREKYHLTHSELEILELAVQHYSPEHIAKIRSSKLNTVRTHVSRLIQKLGSRSLGEATGFAIELSLATEADALNFFGPRQQRGDVTRQVTIPQHDAVVVYSKYGAATGKPVVVLHSLEYGFEPTEQMIEAAQARNLCLYFPRRSGFAGTTPTNTLQQAADIMGGFINALDLTEVALLALSTAAPQALAIANAHDRISQTLLINYGLNIKGKVDYFEPAWIRGLIKMGLAAPASFAAGVEVIRGFWRTFGTERLFKMMYASAEADRQFLEEHLELFERSSDIIYQTNRTNIRIDIMSSFLENRELAAQIVRQSSVSVVNGEMYFTIPAEQLRANAKEFGVEYVVVPGGGRNWAFADPTKLFDFVTADTSK